MLKKLQFFTGAVNDVLDEVKSLRVENEKILEVNAITAKRNITSNLVSDEDKQLYQSFLKNMSNDKPSNLKNVYTSIVNVIETVKERIKRRKRNRYSIRST